jgi:hypothetical protein
MNGKSGQLLPLKSLNLPKLFPAVNQTILMSVSPAAPRTEEGNSLVLLTLDDTERTLINSADDRSGERNFETVVVVHPRSHTVSAFLPAQKIVSYPFRSFQPICEFSFCAVYCTTCSNPRTQVGVWHFLTGRLALHPHLQPRIALMFGTTAPRWTRAPGSNDKIQNPATGISYPDNRRSSGITNNVFRAGPRVCLRDGLNVQSGSRWAQRPERLLSILALKPSLTVL